MNFKIHDKLVNEAESPKGLLYRVIVIYVFSLVSIIILLAIYFGDTSRLNTYFLINSCTVAILTFFIRKSFNIQSQEQHFSVFRIGLFLMLNSSLVSMTGGLALLERDTASELAALLYAPAIVLIIISFNKFVKYVNDNYKLAINLSLTDELTGLPNRRYLNVKLREMENKRGTICIADIDHFKRINDTYGHETGDKVLRNTGLKLSNFSSESVFISRSGGEEFSILIFDNINSEEIIRTIKSSVSDVCNGSVNVTLSIGATIKQKHESTSSVLAAADEALYKAKISGRNCIIFSTK